MGTEDAMTRDTGFNWSKRREHWRLRRDGVTVALAVPYGLRWRALGFLDGQTVFHRLFDRQDAAMSAAEEWAREITS
jgi:hypothetical protein